MRKGKSDAAKAKVYGKIGKIIAQAVRQGGDDPLSNTRLREALAQAKMAKVPNDVIERNLQKSKNSTGEGEKGGGVPFPLPAPTPAHAHTARRAAARPPPPPIPAHPCAADFAEVCSGVQMMQARCWFGGWGGWSRALRACHVRFTSPRPPSPSPPSRLSMKPTALAARDFSSSA